MNRLEMNREYDELQVAEACCLTTGTPLRLEPTGDGWEIQAMDGRIWVTEENDASDYLASPGKYVHLAGHGAIVIEALTPFACIRVKHMQRSTTRRGMGIFAAMERRIGIEA